MNTKITINLRSETWNTTRKISEEESIAYAGRAITTALDVLVSMLDTLDNEGKAHTEAGYKLSYAIHELRQMQ